MAVDWDEFEAVAPAATDWDQFEPLKPVDALPDTGPGDAQIIDPAHAVGGAVSAVLDPISKFTGKVLSTIGNIPADVYNTAGRMTGKFGPMDLPFQEGKPVPGADTVGSAVGDVVKRILTPKDILGLPAGPAGNMATGLGAAAKNAVTGLATPESLSTLPLLEARGARAALALGMGAQAPAQIEDTAKTLADPNVPTAKKWEALGNAGVNLAMTTALALSLTPEQVKAKFSPEEARDAAKGPPATPEGELLNTAKTAPMPEAKTELAKQPQNTEKPNENEAKTPVDETPGGGDGQGDHEPSDQAQPGDEAQPAPGLDAGGNQEGSARLSPGAPGSEVSVKEPPTQTPNEELQRQGVAQTQNEGQPSGGGADQQIGQGAGATPGEVPANAPGEVPGPVSVEKRLADPATFKGKNWTADALQYGASLTDRAQLDELKSLEKKYAKQIETTPKDMANLNELMAASNRKQWVTEAIQGAEGVGDRDVARAQLPADYKAPFAPEPEAGKFDPEKDGVPANARQDPAVPFQARLRATQWDVLKKAYDTGINPNGKRVTAKEKANLLAQLEETANEYKKALAIPDEESLGAKVTRAKEEPAKPAEAKAQMQKQVKKVAKAEGQRSAKDIKTDLVSRLEDALGKAPAEADLEERTRNAIATERNLEPKKDGPTLEERRATLDKAGVGRITIKIPGDGEFNLVNSKEAIQAVLDKAKKLNTDSGGKQRTSAVTGKAKSTGVPNITPEVFRESSEPTHEVTINRGNDTTTALGKAITIPGHESKKFFLTSIGNEYGITEPRTGLRVGHGETIRKAIDSAAEKLNDPKFADYEKIVRDVTERLDKAIPEPKPLQPSKPIVGLGGAVPGEFSTPTIEDQISGEGLAAQRDPGPAIPHDAPTTDSALKGLVSAAKEGFENIKGWLGAVGNKTFPRTTLKNPHLGELGARWISAHIAAKPVAEVFAADVLGNTGISPVKFGAALTEDNLRSIKSAFEAKAEEAENRDEIVAELKGELENLGDMDDEDPKIRQAKAQVKREISRISKLTDEDAERFADKAGKVKSFIGEQGFPFATDEDYQTFLDDPKTKEAIARHQDLWKSVVEPQYKEAMSIDPEFELPSRGQQTGARINLRAVSENDDAPTRDIAGAGTRRGNLLGTLKKKSPFGVEAKGTGDAYHVNYYDIMENTFAKQMEIAAKNRFDNELVKQGQAVIAKPGQRVNIEGQPAVSFPLKRQKVVIPGVGGISQNEHLYINRKLAGEYRAASNVDAKPPNIGFRGFANAFNHAALASGVDATTHAVNQLSTLATLPGGTGNLLRDSMLSALPGRPDAWITIAKTLAKAFKDNRAQLASIAEIGGLKAEHEATSIPVMRQLSQGVAWLDKATRLTLDDTYKNLVQQGLVDGSETSRREFINQVGQYNKRAQGYFKRWVRDTGLAPFVTAGTTFNNLGVRALKLNPGVRATSNLAAGALRGNMLAKIAGSVATVALLNYLFTHNKGGGVMGRPGVPIGDIDLGTNDKNGRPNRLVIFSMIGPGRGARVTGLRGFVEAKKNKLPTGTALGAAARDAINSAFSPWAGPAVRAASIIATGHPAAVDVPRASRVVPPGGNQAWENLKTAIRDANPVVAGIAKAMEPGSAGASEAIKSQLPRFLPQAGKPPEMMKDYPGIVRRAQANSYIEDVIGQARKMEPVARMKYLRESVARLENPNDKRKAIEEFKLRKVLPR